MADLLALRCVSSGLYAAYNNVTALEIEDKPLGGGGFGQNYVCRTLNGVPPADPLVIKVLQDNGQGSAKHGSHTLQRLIARLQDLDTQRQKQGEPPLGTLAAL